MPWKETCAMEERYEFVKAFEAGEEGMAALCRELGVSRVTGYKWIQRYVEEGIEGLANRSRAPHHQPRAVAQDIMERVIAERRVHSHWGPRKIKSWLEQREPGRPWPSASTIGEILAAQGLIVPRKRRRHVVPYTRPFAQCTQPNNVWCADFKGWFRTGDGQRCEPLTISDACTRYLLRCQALLHTAYQDVQPLFEATFREYGLPGAIRTDNGRPFCAPSRVGLSRLSVWWIKLGIVPERIRPGHPEENGRHERLHRTLAQHAITPPKATWRAQQRAFDAFRHEYNHERPHEALGQTQPAAHYQPSPRPHPSRLPVVTYPDHMIVRRVQRHGEFYWKGEPVFLSEVLEAEPIGLDQTYIDTYYRIYFMDVLIGYFDARTLTVQPPLAKLKR